MKLSYFVLLALLIGCTPKPEIEPDTSGAVHMVWTAPEQIIEPVLYPQPYLVQPGEWLSTIALAEYGDTTKWHHIYAWNRQKIGDNPDFIYPYIVLQLRLPTEYAGTTQYIQHTVKAGESLWSIAASEYGDGRAWVLIYHDNKGVIRGIANLPVGQALRIRV